MPNAVLAADIQMVPAAVDPGAPISHRRQTKARLGVGLFGVADAKEGGLHEPDDGGEHSLPRQAAPPQIDLDTLADDRKDTAKSQHLAVLGFVADLAPPGVIAILLAAAIVASGRLNVAVRV